MISHFILYVKEQNRSTAFYTAVLKLAPRLNVPGMTEFSLSAECVLGLMPEIGIKRLLGSNLPDPAKAAGVPRAELYLLVDDASDYLARALSLGATLVSELGLRDWGDTVAYCLDEDGHVLAFAQRSRL